MSSILHNNNNSRRSNQPLIRNLKPHEHIGFDSLPDQLVNKCMQDGFVFNILCIGETGIGKSTLMDSLFNTNFELSTSAHDLHKVLLKANSYDMHESNVKLKLTIAETIAYGDQINKESSFQEILDYVDDQYEAYLQEELKIKRELSIYQDTRIHACLYFISPTGHGLKAIDLACMRKLQNKVNIIPIIAKADTMSMGELKNFKEKIINELNNSEVYTYKFPIDDESVAELNEQMNSDIPFAVVGSTDFINIENKMTRARQYSWGVVEVENESHCDFVKLREMVIRTNMEDMREKTHSDFYEIYRRKRLEELGFTDTDADKNISFQKNCQLKRAAFEQEFQQKEDEIRETFVTRVVDTEAELKRIEIEIVENHEQQMKEFTDEKQKLDEMTKVLDKKIEDFYKIKLQTASTQFQSYCTFTLGRNKKNRY